MSLLGQHGRGCSWEMKLGRTCLPPSSWLNVPMCIGLFPPQEKSSRGLGKERGVLRRMVECPDSCLLDWFRDSGEKVGELNNKRAFSTRVFVGLQVQPWPSAAQWQRDFSQIWHRPQPRSNMGILWEVLVTELLLVGGGGVCRCWWEDCIGYERPWQTWRIPDTWGDAGKGWAFLQQISVQIWEEQCVCSCVPTCVHRPGKPWGSSLGEQQWRMESGEWNHEVF